MRKRLFTIDELATASGYSRVQIHNQIRFGNIKTAFKSSRLVLIDDAEFRRIVSTAISSGKYKTFKRHKRNKDNPND